MGSQTTGLQQSLTPDMEADGALSPRSLPHVTLTTNGAGAAYSMAHPPVKLGGRMRGECQGGPGTPQTQISLSLVHRLPGCPLEAKVSPKSKCVGR